MQIPDLFHIKENIMKFEQYLFGKDKSKYNIVFFEGPSLYYYNVLKEISA